MVGAGRNSLRRCACFPTMHECQGSQVGSHSPQPRPADMTMCLSDSAGRVIAFTKVDLPYGWLGNMAPFPVMHDGRGYRTTEALFQALRFDQEPIREAIRGEKSPMAAKMRA